MKIAYFSNYKECTGYSIAAQRNILALLSANATVTARNVWLNNPSPADIKRGEDECPLKVLACEDNDLNNVDVVVHHTLPHLASPCDYAKNVLMFATETNHFRMSMWPEFCNNNKFNSIITFCHQSANTIRNSGVGTKIHVVPHAIDIEAANNPTLNRIREKNICNFVYVGEYSTRKNTDGLLKAYFRAFSPDDKVLLTLKTFISGQSPEESEATIIKDIKRIQKGGKLSEYPPVDVMTFHTTPFQTHCLSYSTTYSVNVSMGESFGYWPFECLAFGKPYIVSDSCAYREYLDPKHKYGFHVKTTPDIVWDTGGFPYLYTGKETWWRPNSVELSEVLESAYMMWKQNPDKYNKYCETAKHHAHNFSFETIGKKLLSILEK
jgi:glycosyltransferase involved in cell wall biosynthesis